ncbi:complexed with cef1p [Arthrobotrys conoides]|uniref:Complexed with cef1p n=1 Tax=Arthrobotrys conoides TaxID=74498 RepID=A0AAN8NJ75_9PEZI
MTTAHRPTFDPAVGKETQRGPAYHQRLLPAHTVLKVRKPGQGGAADGKRDLRAELLKAEAAHYAKLRGETISSRDDGGGDDLTSVVTGSTRKGRIDNDENEDEETPEAKRRRILEESRDLDADSDGSDKGSNKDSDDDSDSGSDDSDEDSEDETAELMRELEKIKKERAAAKEKEEKEKAEEEEAQREIDIARGNPLLNTKAFNVKRRWDDDVIFRNQARGVEEKGKKKEFVNDLLRSDFHKKFMNKYVR